MSGPSGRWLRQQQWSAYLYLLPGFLVFGTFVFYPLTQSAWVSWFHWDGITVATWAGLDNYGEVLTDPAIWTALAHSGVFLVFYAALPVAVGLALAGLMSRVHIRGLAAYRALLFIPQILSSVVVAVAWRWIYAEDGPLNDLLRLVGLDNLATAWLGDFDTALPAVGLIGTWVAYGLCMVLFLAGAQKIPAELYEAVRLDGAGPVREFFTVTLPALRGEISVALVLTITNALRNFDIVWNTTTGGPGTATTVPSVYIYQGAFITHDVGRAGAIGVLLMLLILAVTGLVLWLLRERHA